MRQLVISVLRLLSNSSFSSSFYLLIGIFVFFFVGLAFSSEDELDALLNRFFLDLDFGFFFKLLLFFDFLSFLSFLSFLRSLLACLSSRAFMPPRTAFSSRWLASPESIA